MPNPGQELSSIDFKSMLGGPLSAVVEAQAEAALTTVNFIKSVGFKAPPDPPAKGSHDPEATETGDPIYVTFKYPKEVIPYEPAEFDEEGKQTKPAVPAKFEEMKLKVPILTIFPIPYLRIEETKIDFNAKINSMEYRKLDTNLNINASLEAKQRWPGGSANLKVNASYQRNSRQGSKVNRTYSMQVHIRAVQDEIPEGMERVLGILQDAIQSEPVPKTGTETNV